MLSKCVGAWCSGGSPLSLDRQALVYGWERAPKYCPPVVSAWELALVGAPGPGISVRACSQILPARGVWVGACCRWIASAWCLVVRWLSRHCALGVAKPYAPHCTLAVDPNRVYPHPRDPRRIKSPPRRTRLRTEDRLRFTPHARKRGVQRRVQHEDAIAALLTASTCSAVADECWRATGVDTSKDPLPIVFTFDCGVLAITVY